MEIFLLPVQEASPLYILGVGRAGEMLSSGQGAKDAGEILVITDGRWLLFGSERSSWGHKKRIKNCGLEYGNLKRWGT